jgi:hypothetical protein
MHRRFALWAGIGLAALTCATAVPAAAYAAGTISITFAGNPASNEPAVLQIDANATTPINSLTAELLSAPGGTDEYSITDLTFASGELTDGIWTATVPAGAVPPGTYTISVTAGDTGGDTVTDADAGSLAFLNQPTLTASSNVSAISYGSQSATFSGQLTAVPPGGGTAVAEGDVAIYYSVLGQTTPTFLTDTASDGTYSGTVQNLSGGSYTLSANATSTTAAAQSGQVIINTDFSTTNITARLTPGRAKYGAHVTLAGKATYQVAGTSTNLPLSNYAVEIMAGSTTLRSVQTNAQGQYTATVPTTDGSYFTVTTGTGNYLLDQTSAYASLTVQLPVYVRSFTAKLEPDGTVKSTVCLKNNAGRGYNSAPNIGEVQLQYASRLRGPWRRLGELIANSDTVSVSCSAEGGEVLSDLYSADGQNYPDGLIGAKLASAYYRVEFGGDTAYQRFYSKAVHSSLDLTRITGFSVSPTSISSGGRVEVSGTLWEHGRSWRHYGHRVVGIFLYTRSQGVQLLGGLRTSSNGHFRVSIQFTGSGRARLYAIYPGDKTHLWSGTREIGFSVSGATRAGLTRAEGLRDQAPQLAAFGQVWRAAGMGLHFVTLDS